MGYGPFEHFTNFGVKLSNEDDELAVGKDQVTCEVLEKAETKGERRGRWQAAWKLAHCGQVSVNTILYVSYLIN